MRESKRVRPTPRGTLVAALSLAASLLAAVAPGRACAQPAPSTATSRRLLTLSGRYQPRYRGGWLFDASIRNALRARSPQGRAAAEVASDALLALNVAGPWAATTILGISHGRDWGAVAQLGLVDVEGLALTLVVAEAFKLIVARERPYATDANLADLCEAPGMERDPRCGPGRNVSFLSGHSSTSFASAGLLCAQTAYASAPGDPVALVACGTAMGFAAATAALRIVADKHHATDILAGMVLGLTAGLAIPMLLHFVDGAPLPVAREIAPAGHDYGPMMLAVVAGVAVGGAVPVFFGLSHGGTPLGVRAVGFVPWVVPGGAGAGILGAF